MNLEELMQYMAAAMALAMMACLVAFGVAGVVYVFRALRAPVLDEEDL
jgi:hypothetical protein